MPRSASDFASIPEDLQIPDGTGQPFSGTAFVTASGNPLLISNSPEPIWTADPVVVLSRSLLPDWRARLFYHHQNKGPALRIAPFFINGGNDPLEIFVARNSGSLEREPFRTAHRDPAIAGLNTLGQYFRSRPVGNEVDRYVATVPPQSNTLAAIQTVAPGECVAGMYDWGFRIAGNASDRRRLPPIWMGVAAWRNRSLPTRAQLEGAIAAPDKKSLRRTRGVYRAGDRTGRILFVVPEDKQPRWLDLAGPEVGVYAHPLSGEFLRDGVYNDTGQLPISPGNYGVVYDLEIQFTNPQQWATRVVCLLNLAGGYGGSVLEVAGAVTPRTGLIRPAFGSHIWHEIRLMPGAVQKSRLRFSLPGGASGAHRLYFWCQK